MSAQFSLFGITLFRERPGVISHGACWVCVYGGIPGWIHTRESLLTLLWEVVMEYKNDRYLVGY